MFTARSGFWAQKKPPPSPANRTRGACGRGARPGRDLVDSGENYSLFFVAGPLKTEA